MLMLANCVALALLLLALWYVHFVRQNRQRSLEALRWVETALAGHGRVVGVHWMAPSRLHAQLRLPPSVFQHASVMVQVEPREAPLTWLWTRVRRQPEIVTFEADLEIPPEFNLELQNQRWCGRTRRALPANAGAWETHHVAPFMITTRREWQREGSGMMDALVASRERDFLSISYRKESPHFVATLPISALAPQTSTCAGLFDVLRELAGGASASRF